MEGPNETDQQTAALAGIRTAQDDAPWHFQQDDLSAELPGLGAKILRVLMKKITSMSYPGRARLQSIKMQASLEAFAPAPVHYLHSRVDSPATGALLLVGSSIRGTQSEDGRRHWMMQSILRSFSLGFHESWQ